MKRPLFFITRDGDQTTYINIDDISQVAIRGNSATVTFRNGQQTGVTGENKNALERLLSLLADFDASEGK